MPVRNGADHVSEALEALLAQDHTDFELLISDNASDDSTGISCRGFASRDPRVRYMRNDRDLGALENFSRVFNLSRGEYFMWAGHHDLWAPSYVRKCVEMLDANPRAVLCHAHTTWIDANGRTLPTPLAALEAEAIDVDGPSPESRLSASLRRLGYGVAIYGLIRSTALRQTRKFVNVYGTDLVLLTELASLGQIVRVPEPLFFQRVVEQPSNSVVGKWLSLSPLNRPNISYPIFSMFGALATVILRMRIPGWRKLILLIEALYWVNRTFALWIEVEFGIRRALKRVMPRPTIALLKRIRGTPRALGDRRHEPWREGDAVNG